MTHDQGSRQTRRGENPRPQGRRSTWGLKPRQQDLLQEIVRSGGVPIDQADGRVLRPLRSAGLVQVSGSRVEATPDGLRHARQNSGHLPARSRLNEKQEELLRLVLRSGPVPSEEVDGRVARALLARGLVTLRDDLVTATSAGRTYFDEQPPAAPRRGRRRAENPRAAVIRRATRELESVIPPGSEVLVGNIMAAADDLVDAFRRHARKLDDGRSG
jgi:hypothetical protein